MILSVHYGGPRSQDKLVLGGLTILALFLVQGCVPRTAGGQPVGSPRCSRPPGPPAAHPANGVQIRIYRVIESSKAVTVYHRVINEGPQGHKIACLTGHFFDANGRTLGSVLTSFFVDGFSPDWQDISSSLGDSVLALSCEVPASGAEDIVSVGEKTTPGRVATVRLQLETDKPGIHVTTWSRAAQADLPGEP